jgi:Transposase DDE domain group 1
VKRRRLYPRVRVDARGTSAMSQAGGVLLVETIRAAGLDEGLSRGLASWRKPGSIHDPAKVLLDLAVAVALRGDCLADAGVVRAEPAVFGCVASDATVSRTIAALAGDDEAACARRFMGRRCASCRTNRVSFGTRWDDTL